MLGGRPHASRPTPVNQAGVWGLELLQPFPLLRRACLHLGCFRAQIRGYPHPPGAGSAQGPGGRQQKLTLAPLTAHSLLEESYVMKDPFTWDKHRFLILGSRCSVCSRLVCVGPVRKPPPCWGPHMTVGEVTR